MGFPIVVKPNDLSQGALVAKVYNKREYYRAARLIFRETQVLLVQKHYTGRDYRVVIFDKELVTAYERIPFTIIGDGKSTIATLINERLELLSQQRPINTDTAGNPRIRAKLTRLHKTPEDVLEKGYQLVLLDNANLSTGGEAIDITDKIHPSFSDLAISITNDLGLRLCGVDIMTGDLSMPLDQQSNGYIVIEVNGAPSMDNYAALGTRQAHVVDKLFLRILRAMENDPA
jgi:D-alanine-D-alanine ligase-like ATP-grasp enzyme